jgi:hypothetical protein
MFHAPNVTQLVENVRNRERGKFVTLRASDYRAKTHHAYAWTC